VSLSMIYGGKPSYLFGVLLVASAILQKSRDGSHRQ
jgi:hypothetical protein